MSVVISQNDKRILRELAKKQLDLAKREENQKRIKQWYEHNSLKGDRPLIHLEMGSFEQEILPDRMQCVGEYARMIEKRLLSNFLNQELFDDDRVTPDCYEMNYDSWFILFNIPIEVEHTKARDGSISVGHHFKSVIKDLETDYHKLGETVYGVDINATLARKNILEELIGDILPVQLQMNGLYSVPTQMLVHFMSMEDMMYNMYDYPELFKEMMQRIAKDTINYYRYLEEKRVILPTVGHEALGQGSWCYNTELPGWAEYNQRIFTTKDVWGFMDSQETVGISPEMYEEYIFPCYQKIADQYGLLSYGCCEKVDPIWDNCISKLTNLRKVSISPWCNEEFMGERLRGSKVIYHRKPSPNYLGIGNVLEEEAVRCHIRKSLNAAQGCKMEIAQRDVYTINHDIDKARRYVKIIREEIENHWKA